MVNRGEEKVRIHMNVVPRSFDETKYTTERYANWSLVGREKNLKTARCDFERKEQVWSAKNCCD